MDSRETLLQQRLEGANARLAALEAQMALVSTKLGIPYQRPGGFDVPTHVRDLVRAGKRLDAIRELRGMGLTMAEATSAVDGL